MSQKTCRTIDTLHSVQITQNDTLFVGSLVYDMYKDLALFVNQANNVANNVVIRPSNCSRGYIHVCIQNLRMYQLHWRSIVPLRYLATHCSLLWNREHPLEPLHFRSWQERTAPRWPPWEGRVPFPTSVTPIRTQYSSLHVHKNEDE